MNSKQVANSLPKLTIRKWDSVDMHAETTGVILWRYPFWEWCRGKDEVGPMGVGHGRATSGPRARSGPRRPSIRPATLLGNNIAIRPAKPQPTKLWFHEQVTKVKFVYVKRVKAKTGVTSHLCVLEYGIERQWLCFSPTMKKPFCQSCWMFGGQSAMQNQWANVVSGNAKNFRMHIKPHENPHYSSTLMRASPSADGRRGNALIAAKNRQSREGRHSGGCLCLGPSTLL